MSWPQLVSAGVLLAALSAPAAGITVHECVDESGETFWSDTCPPGTEKRADKRLPGKEKEPPTELEIIAAQNPVTLYAAAGCDACELVRIQLRRRFVPFRDVDVTSDAASQAELQRTAGALTVPTVAVGQTVLMGYNKEALSEALSAAGYPPDADAGATAGSAGPRTGAGAGVEGSEGLESAGGTAVSGTPGAAAQGGVEAANVTGTPETPVTGPGSEGGESVPGAEEPASTGDTP